MAEQPLNANFEMIQFRRADFLISWILCVTLVFQQYVIRIRIYDLFTTMCIKVNVLLTAFINCIEINVCLYNSTKCNYINV